MNEHYSLFKSLNYLIFCFCILFFCHNSYAETYKSWNFSYNTQSWTSGGNITPKPTPNHHNADGWPGIIYADCTGSDPYFISPSFSLSAKKYHKIVIKIVTAGGYRHEMRVYWKRSYDSSFVESRSMATSYYSSSGGSSMKTLTLDVGKNDNWSGTINKIRIDPSRSTCSGTIRYHIDYVSIEGTPTAPPKPSQTSPSSYQTFYKGDSINFKWNKNGYSGTTWLKIFHTSSTPIYDKKFSGSSFNWTAPTNKSGTFRWEIALNADGLWSKWSSRYFYVKDPPKPSLSSPSNGSSFDFDSRIKFQWNNNGVSGSNRLRILTAGSKKIIDEFSFVGGASSKSWNSGHTPKGNYLWQVAFQRNNAWSGWSERQFSIKEPPKPPSPSFEAPENISTFFCGDKINFRWNNNGYHGPIWLIIYDPHKGIEKDTKLSSGSTSYNWSSNLTETGTFRCELAIQVHNVWSKWSSRSFKLSKPVLEVSRTEMMVGDTLNLSCNIGKQSAGKNIGFFVDTQSADPVGHPLKTNNEGKATLPLTATKDWYNEVSLSCRDEQRKTTSNVQKVIVKKVEPVIQINPLSGPQDGNFTISGSGFSLNHSCSLKINGPKGKSSTIATQSNASGSISHKWTPSKDAHSGYYHCTAIDDRTGNQSKSLSWIVFFNTTPSADEPHGILARTIDQKEVYWVKYSKKWLITGSTDHSDEPFFGLGYKLSDVQWFAKGALSHLDKGKDILNNNDNFCYRSTNPNESAVFLIENNESHSFYDWPNFKAQKFEASDIFWASPEGVDYIQSKYPKVKAPMIRVSPLKLSFEE
ncbi:secreted protein [Candidatus Magnetomorum sp. HK-1]|nr:secreted protein [Candidatus Magnetomorum sp. HK-1]